MQRLLESSRSGREGYGGLGWKLEPRGRGRDQAGASGGGSRRKLGKMLDKEGRLGWLRCLQVQV